MLSRSDQVRSGRVAIYAVRMNSLLHVTLFATAVAARPRRFMCSERNIREAGKIPIGIAVIDMFFYAMAYVFVCTY